MQRDMKVGLALGVLLIGIVGALFFRRDSEHGVDDPPPLQDGKKLDETIAENADGPYPYMTGPEDFAGEPAARKSEKQAAVPPKTAKVDDAFQIPEFLTKEDQQAQREFLANRKPVAPNPIVNSKSAAFPGSKGPAAAPPPAHNDDWEVVRKPRTARDVAAAPDTREAPARAAAVTDAKPAPGARPTAVATGVTVVATSAGVTHVVKAGDTLTGLASRYLGDRSRYLEIFEANRQILKSPHQLPEGARLTIPDAGGNPVAEPAPVRKVEPIAAKPSLPSITVEEPGDLLDVEPDTPAPPAAAASAAPSPIPPAAPVREAAAPRTYRVERGDTLERLAMRFYGKRSKANDILEANRPSLASPESMREGMQIVIP